CVAGIEPPAGVEPERAASADGDPEAEPGAHAGYLDFSRTGAARAAAWDVFSDVVGDHAVQRLSLGTALGGGGSRCHGCTDRRDQVAAGVGGAGCGCGGGALQYDPAVSAVLAAFVHQYALELG